MLAFEFGGFVLVHRPVDTEWIPVALTLIAWESQKSRHNRRSRQSQSRNEENE